MSLFYADACPTCGAHGRYDTAWIGPSWTCVGCGKYLPPEPDTRTGEMCPECGSAHPYLHDHGCVELARIQRHQLADWRASGGKPDPGRWGAREAEIERLLDTDAAGQEDASS